MSTLQVTTLRNAASSVANGTLNADGTTTFGGIVNFATGQTFPTAASTTPPVSPAVGATWYDTNSTPPIFKVWNGSAWVPVPATASSTAPTSPFLGQQWIDTSQTPPVGKLWNGSSWMPATVALGTSAPTGTLTTGQLWSDTSTTPATLKAWNGSAWVPVQAAGGGGSGSVTSVDGSGGTTGLTLTGGPITASGTLTLGGILAVASGGTGASTLSGLQAAALPTQSGNAGKVLSTDGSTASWIASGGTGTVTSVDVSGGTTGLTYSGGPITASGTLTMAGILAVANGGTGASTLSGLQAAALPTQSGNAGKVLSTDGSTASWISSGGTGTVTSIDVSGGTTGLTTSGGPVTASGTITLAGTLAIANGGTGQTTQNSALNALLPTQSGNVGKYLGTDGSNASWQTSFVPPGSVIWYAASTAPYGFLEADGAAISRTSYAALFAAIGVTFGAGDGGTTFNIPDLRSQFIRGWDNGRGVDVGRVFGSAQTDGIKASTAFGFEALYYAGQSATGEFFWIPAYGELAAVTAFGGTGQLGLGNAADTHPLNIALLPCIKY